MRSHGLTYDEEGRLEGLEVAKIRDVPFEYQRGVHLALGFLVSLERVERHGEQKQPEMQFAVMPSRLQQRSHRRGDVFRVEKVQQPVGTRERLLLR